MTISHTITKHLQEIIDELGYDFTINEMAHCIQSDIKVDFEIRKVIWVLYNRSILFSPDALCRYFEVEQGKISNAVYDYHISTQSIINRHRA